MNMRAISEAGADRENPSPSAHVPERERERGREREGGRERVSECVCERVSE